MNFLREVFIVSSTGSKEANCTLHDLAGNVLTGYKGGHSAKNTLCVIGRDYLISALIDRPAIMVWQFNKIDPYKKIKVPGRVTALAISKCCKYCVAGIGKLIYIWEVESGNLINVIDYHSQDVTKVKISCNGTYLVTGGKDGIVCVFCFSDVLRIHSLDSSRKTKPELPKAKHVWLGHTAAITDIDISRILDFFAKVYTASKDFTSRIYQIDSGELMCVIRLDAPLTTVAVDIGESMLFLGSYSGDIFRIKLINTPETEIDFPQTEECFKFEKHTREITSLKLSEHILISSSEDGKLCIWNTSDFTCIKEYQFSGTITNLLTCTMPPSLNDKEYKPDFHVGNFKKDISDEDDDDDGTPMHIGNNNLSLFDTPSHDVFVFGNLMHKTEDEIKSQMAESNVEMDRLTRINNELYAFALGDVSVEEPVESDCSPDNVNGHVSD